MSVTPSAEFPFSMNSEERLKALLALDHDARQPRHVLEMGLRNLRLVAAELERFDSDPRHRQSLRQRMKAELICVQVAVRQVVDGQQDLVDAIRLDFDEARPTLRRIVAGDLIERVLTSNRAIAGRIRLRGPRSRLTLISDERWLERILNNLVVNALMHSGGDAVLLGARRQREDIVFEVRDNGRTLTREKAPTFDPGRTNSHWSSVPGSACSGRLGLYNVGRLTERLGGTVECTSDESRGTLFRVRLHGPLGRADFRPRNIGDAKTAVRNKTVVVLDDDLAVLRTTERVFEALGIEVYADHDPLRWLSVITDFKRAPDLVLMDFQLKGQDCSLLLEIVQRMWADEQPKIAVVTGHASNPIVARLSEYVPVLEKPFSEGTFNFLIEVLSGTRQFPDAGFVR